MRRQRLGHFQAGHQAAVKTNQLKRDASLLQGRFDLRQRQHGAPTRGVITAKAVDGATTMVPQRQGVLLRRVGSRAPGDEVAQGAGQVHGNLAGLFAGGQLLQRPALARARLWHQAVAACLLHVDARVFARAGTTANLQHHIHLGVVLCLEHVDQVTLGTTAIEQVRGHQVHQQGGFGLGAGLGWVVVVAATTTGGEQAQQGQGAGVLQKGTAFHGLSLQKNGQKARTLGPVVSGVKQKMTLVRALCRVPWAVAPCGTIAAHVDVPPD